jgi:hypothetical protein
VVPYAQRGYTHTRLLRANRAPLQRGAYSWTIGGHTHLAGTGQVHKLLTPPSNAAPDNTRLQTPIVEHNPQLTPTGDRTSIALPSDL